MEVGNNPISVAKQIILEAFSFLREEGYSVETKIMKDTFFSENFESTFINETIGREISISYTKGSVEKGGNLKYTFSLSITRLPYDGVKDFFSLFVYLSSLGRDFDTNIVNHFDENEARLIVEKIANALKTYLWDVVKGEKWLEGFYPRW